MGPDRATAATAGGRTPTVPADDIEVASPPELPSASGALARLLPLALSLAVLGVMAASMFSGPGRARGPAFLAFPLMTLASLAMTTLSRRGTYGSGRLDAVRAEYLAYLSGLRSKAAKIAADQQCSLRWRHPDPDTLWTLVGGPRMWERQPADSDCCVVRAGIGTRPLAARLVAPPTRPGAPVEPVTSGALERFLSVRSVITGAPVTVELGAGEAVTADGDPDRVRAVLRAMVCQLAVLHGPDRLLIAAIIGGGNRSHWDWLKWLPHNQHPSDRDAAGSARMVYRTTAEAEGALGRLTAPVRVIVVADSDGMARPGVGGATVLRVGDGRAGDAVRLDLVGADETLEIADQLSMVQAVTCARRLARYRHRRGVDTGLSGVGQVGSFDPVAQWSNATQSARLRIPIGTDPGGEAVELDIKEAAQGGIGPHGLCVGATGSGKSELLRTIALGMIAGNSPEDLNLLLIDFKGGATFSELERAPHVAAVVTNLSDQVALVDRMRDALAGELNRRQRLLRDAGNFGSVSAYQVARRSGAPLGALPTLLIVVDEFSELLSQHPDFAETFVAIGRLGRSLCMHLLLASQRLDEGRLRGLDAHLSYRICLKTLSASESRVALGTADAFELPNRPGAGLLRSGGAELIAFQAAFVSGRVRAAGPSLPVDSVRRFTAKAVGSVTREQTVESEQGPSVLRAVLDRMSGLGPRAHRVWLPPLGESPDLEGLLRDSGPKASLAVPIGIVDRPFEQTRAPLLADLSGAAGNVAVVGAPQSGKSTALCTLISALAASYDAGRVQFYCLDFGGGRLATVADLPHVGAIAGRAEPRLVARMVAELQSIVRAREVARGNGSADRFADVFLVVDGWAGLQGEFDGLEGPITAIAGQGLSFGVHVMLSASRWAEIRPALRDQLGTRIELRLGDPADSEFDRRRAHQVPHDRPGRGLTRDGLHMLIALPHVDAAWTGDAVAPPIPMLPQRMDHESLVRRAPDDGVLLGIEESKLSPIAIDFDREQHLLIFGDSQCGKTSALRILCREIVRTTTAAEARLLIVDFRRALLGVVESEHLLGYAGGPAALATLVSALTEQLRRRMPPAEVSQAKLRAGSWWSGPGLYVVVDDYDLVSTAGGNPLTPLVEYLPYARDLGLHLIVARRFGGLARAMFEPLLADLRDLGCAGLMMSARPDDVAPFGSARPEPLPPGRAILVTRCGGEQLVQVAWDPPP